MALGLVAGLVLGLAAVLTRSPLLLAVTQWLRPLRHAVLETLLSMGRDPASSPPRCSPALRGSAICRAVGRLGIRTLAFFWAHVARGRSSSAFVVAARCSCRSRPITADQQAALPAGGRRRTTGGVRHAGGADSHRCPVSSLSSSRPTRCAGRAVDGNLLPLDRVHHDFRGGPPAALPDEKRHALTDPGRRGPRRP